MSRALRLVGAHWYAPLFVAMLVSAWLLARTPLFMEPGGEAALLFDLCLTAPILYCLCYAKRQPVQVTLIRALAIASGGLWLATWIIPPSEQLLLPQLAPLRWIGIAVLALFELKLSIAAVRMAFSGRGSAEDLRAASGAPIWIARLMLWEARMWRGLWRLIRGRDRRDPPGS